MFTCLDHLFKWSDHCAFLLIYLVTIRSCKTKCSLRLSVQHCTQQFYFTHILSDPNSAAMAFLACYWQLCMQQNTYLKILHGWGLLRPTGEHRLGLTEILIQCCPERFQSCSTMHHPWPPLSPCSSHQLIKYMWPVSQICKFCSLFWYLNHTSTPKNVDATCFWRLHAWRRPFWENQLQSFHCALSSFSFNP